MFYQKISQNINTYYNNWITRISKFSVYHNLNFGLFLAQNFQKTWNVEQNILCGGFYFFEAWQTTLLSSYGEKWPEYSSKIHVTFIFVWAVPLRTVKTLFVVVLKCCTPVKVVGRDSIWQISHAPWHYRTKTLGWMWAKHMLSNYSDGKNLWSTWAARKARILYELLLICLSFPSLAMSPCCGSICPPMVP